MIRGKPRTPSGEASRDTRSAIDDGQRMDLHGGVDRERLVFVGIELGRHRIPRRLLPSPGTRAMRACHTASAAAGLTPMAGDEQDEPIDARQIRAATRVERVLDGERSAGRVADEVQRSRPRRCARADGARRCAPLPPSRSIARRADPMARCRDRAAAARRRNSLRHAAAARARAGNTASPTGRAPAARRAAARRPGARSCGSSWSDSAGGSERLPSE